MNTIKRQEEEIVKTKAIRFIDVGVAEYADVEVKAPTDDDVIVNIQYTTVSNGTERANLMGHPNTSVFARPGDKEKPRFPKILGYSGAGVVEWVGKNVTKVKVGDRVATSSGHHMKHLVRPEDKVTKLPDNVELSVASMAHIANFPLGAVRKCGVEVGESALVAGLGILGMFAVMLLKVSGACPVIASDPNPERRAMALRLGADVAVDPTEADYVARVREATDGRMVQAAVEVTGLGAGLDGVLDCMAKFGRVALLGCTRDSNFNIDYYRKVHGPGISLIGAYAGARPERDSFRGWWSEMADVETIVRLCAMERIDPSQMICETHSPKQAPDVYKRLAEDKNFPVCVQFDWREEK